MTRGGRVKDRSEPQRRCIVTGESQPVARLLRFVVGPDGTVVPDLLGKLPGRGIWVAAERDALEAAVTKKLFSRAAKMQVAVPDGLIDDVERQLARRVVELISLGRKSGAAVCGFEKVKGWLSGGASVRVLLQASDASERGKAKLWTPEGARYFDCLSQAELGLAFGRETVVHAALSSGGLGNRVVEEAAKLRGLRQKAGGNGAAAKG
ncbi:RNA-binding protein [Aestuariibius sp. 2305UL40-4]|uniref:RNA-binding protein n=1 Tax=Aestuariibius violaceus TaxID=3234132 RepID=UPI00345E65ED